MKTYEPTANDVIIDTAICPLKMIFLFLFSLREKVESQELKLRKLRAMRGQADQVTYISLFLPNIKKKTLNRL